MKWLVRVFFDVCDVNGCELILCECVCWNLLCGEAFEQLCSVVWW